MVGFAILLVVVIAFAVGYLVALSTESMPPVEAEPDPDPEAELRAAVELHRIRRNLDVSWTKTQQRQDGEALRRHIRAVLNEDDDAR